MGENMNSIKNYIFEKDFEIIVKSSYIDIINYKDILNFDDNNITIMADKKVIIKGSNLSISKLLDNELLIIGNINTIELL